MAATKDIEAATVDDDDDNPAQLRNTLQRIVHDGDVTDDSDCDGEADDVPVVRDEASGCVHYKRKAMFVVSICLLGAMPMRNCIKRECAQWFNDDSLDLRIICVQRKRILYK